MSNILISPSILNADFARLGEECLSLQNSGADWIHCDVMDGVFVPNISFGLPVVQDIERIVEIPLDVHLMITNPLNYVERFVDAGAGIVTVHYETSHIEKTLASIKKCGAKAGVAIKPSTSVEELVPLAEFFDMVLIMSVEPGFGGQKFMPIALEKIKRARELFPYKLIQVDGGINESTASLCVNAGANVLVAGSAIINCQNRAEIIEKLKNL